MFTFLKHLGFTDFQMRTGFSLCVPVGFVQPSTVKRSFAFLNAGADFSRHETRVLCGKHSTTVQFSPRCRFCSGISPLSSITFCRFSKKGSTVSSAAEGFSP